jgi:hypothetical protein
MRGLSRRGTLKVTDGRVQKKNNWELTPNYYSHDQRELVIDRKRPGDGYRHVLLQRDVEIFISLLPDWTELSHGLNAIVLDEGSWGRDGYHSPGVVHICAWGSDLWRETSMEGYEEHKDIWERLGVPCEEKDDDDGYGLYMLCKWTKNTARAYQLLHILTHELGHHHDRMTTKSQKRTARGESYAEGYARQYEELVWESFTKHFPLD